MSDGSSAAGIIPPLNVYRDLWGQSAGPIDEISNGDLYQSVEIGPDSEAADIYLLENGKHPPSLQPAQTFPGEQTRTWFKDAIRVSLGRPYFGPIRGPVRVYPRFSDYDDGSTRFGLGTIASIVAYPHRLHLIFRKCVPPYLTDRRPDAVRIYQEGVLANETAGESTALIVPGFGRREQLFSFTQITGSVSGTFTWRVYGRQLIQGIPTETLLQTLAVTAANQTNYEYEGRFDFYRITRQTAGFTAANGARCTVMLRD